MKSLLLTAALLAAPAFADEPAPIYNHVDFQVDVAQQTANDQLNATLSTELNDADPAVLAQQLSEAINDAQKKAAAFPTVKVSTGNQQTWPVYSEGLTSSNKLKGWRGHAELRLETKDFKAAGQLIALLQSRLQLNGISFSVADNTRRSIEGQLSQQAIAAFRARAELIRDAWNAKSYRMVSMNINSAGNNQGMRPMFMVKSAMASASAPAQDFSGGDTPLTVTVSGTIELQP